MNLKEQIEDKIYYAYISLAGMTPTQHANVDNGLAKLTKEVLKLMEPYVCIKLTELGKIIEDTKVSILGMFCYQGPPSRHWIDTKGQFWEGWNKACDKLSTELLKQGKGESK